jgi:hypothetical protein
MSYKIGQIQSTERCFPSNPAFDFIDRIMEVTNCIGKVGVRLISSMKDRPYHMSEAMGIFSDLTFVNSDTIFGDFLPALCRSYL